MDKEQFLRLQYLRMINSDDFIVEQWRSSITRFLSDLWDRTPNNALGRYLAPVDPSLGFSPDNVEWQFPRARRRPVKAKKVSKVQVDRPTKDERRKLKATQREAEKQAKRQAIADEFALWEALKQMKR